MVEFDVLQLIGVYQLQLGLFIIILYIVLSATMYIYQFSINIHINCCNICSITENFYRLYCDAIGFNIINVRDIVYD